MKVLKFGGTSVGTAESLRNVKKIVESNPLPVIVVVSALGGLTDRLISTAGKAAEGDLSYKQDITAMRNRHFDIIDEVVPAAGRADTVSKVSELLDELERYYDGISLLHDLPTHTLDVIVSFGERMSSVIVTSMIDGATRHDSLKFIKTEKWYSRNIADQKLTTKLIKEEFEGFDGVGIVPGFISTDRETGAITNLGRGGSDFTAALIAAALDADLLEIWTDVNGFMTADPRVIPEARVMPCMSFIESMELCSFGAKVIYPPTIYPVFHKNIPIKILNTFNPEAPGTIISDRGETAVKEIKGISSIKDISVFTLKGESMLDAEEIKGRTFNALSKIGVTVLLANQDPETSSLTFAIAGRDSETTETRLNTEFAPELSKGHLNKISKKGNLAIVAVVGEGMRDRERLSARIINTLHRDSIPVVTYTQKPSATTLSFIVPEEFVRRTLQLIHNLIF